MSQTVLRPPGDPTGPRPAATVTRPAPSTPAPRGPGRRLRLTDLPGRARWRWAVTDSLAIVVLAALVTWLFAPAFGHATVWRAGLGGALAGLAVGLTVALRRLPGWVCVPAGVVAYFLLGGAFAMPSTALAGVLPTGRTPSGLATGAVQAWKTALTVDPPIGESGALLVVPFATLLIATAAAAWLAFGSGRPLTAWLPLAGAAAVGILFGLHDAVAPVPIALGFTVGVLTWTAYRRSALRRQLIGTNRATPGIVPLLTGTLVVAVAACVAILVAPLLHPTGERLVLRDLVKPPLNVHAWPSPLQQFRAEVTDRADTPLLTVDGFPAGATLRVATLDLWDGVTYHVSNDASLPDSGTFRRIGDRVSERTPGRPAEVDVTVENYGEVWVPTIGQTISVRFAGDRGVALKENLFYNQATGTAISTGGLAPGDRYRLQVVVPDQPDEAGLANATAADTALPVNAPTPDALKEKAAEWMADAASDPDQAERLQRQLREGYYSNGVTHPSLPGHSAYRLNRLFTDEQMVGDEEQYAVAMALLARESGLPARVVYGFRPDGAGRVTVRGRDASAWVEIKYAGLGWVAYFPTPPRDRLPRQETDPNPGRIQPQVENPPPPPQRPERVPPEENQPEPPKDSDETPRRFDLARALPVVLGVGIPLLLVAVPVGLILGAKLRRRRLRRQADRTSDRVSGGWAEVVDRARDLGVGLDRSWTRSEGAKVLAGAFARSSDGVSDPRQLAWRADASVFGTGSPSPTQAQEYWRGVRDVVRGMARSVGLPRRLRAALSLASLRQRSDSPVPQPAEAGATPQRPKRSGRSRARPRSDGDKPASR